LSYQILQGDVREQLASLPDGSVHCCVTSPPYWALRDYGVGGQLGLEATPELFVAAMVDVFREVKRVLRDDGTLWLNLGDSYAHSGACGGGSPVDERKPEYGRKGNASDASEGRKDDRIAQEKTRGTLPPGLKPKDLVGIPWRVAFALQADGWYLRQDIIWHKRSPMPESVRDRCTKSHEYIFLLSKSPRYYFDAEAIKEPAVLGQHVRSRASNFKKAGSQDDKFGSHDKGAPEIVCDGQRNLRDVWSLSSSPYKGAHFATFPPAIPERAIKAGTSERGCCPACGSPWVRVVERTSIIDPRPATTGAALRESQGRLTLTTPVGRTCGYQDSKTTGWKQSCKCEAAEPVPCKVLEPFCGSGTTLAVAKVLGRDSVGIELNPEYITLAQQRIDSADIGMLVKRKPRSTSRKQSGQLILFEAN